MDNLVFYSKVSEGGGVTIGTVNRRNITYETDIKNLAEIQFPTVFIVDRECETLLLDEIKKVEYDYDIATDTIHCKLPVYGKNKLQWSLQRKTVSETDLVKTLEQRIACLELELYELNPYEVIHEDCYPQWQTLDEFKALDSWKYFNAFDNMANYYMKTEIPNCKAGCHIAIYNGEFGPDKLRYVIDLNKRDNQYCPTSRVRHQADGGMINTSEPDYIIKYRNKALTYYNTDGNRINLYLYQWVYEYVIGWILLNSQLIAFRSSKVEIHIRDNNVSFAIHRTKKYNLPVNSVCQLHQNQGIVYIMYPPAINLFINGQRYIKNGLNVLGHGSESTIIPNLAAIR